MEKYEVYNPTLSGISFSVIPSATLPPMMNIASHHRRRLMKGLRYNISVPSMQAVDLIKITGFTASDLDVCPELQQLINRKRLLKVSDMKPVEVVTTPVVVINNDQVEVVNREVEEVVVNKTETVGFSPVFVSETSIPVPVLEKEVESNLEVNIPVPVLEESDIEKELEETKKPKTKGKRGRPSKG